MLPATVALAAVANSSVGYILPDALPENPAVFTRGTKVAPQGMCDGQVRVSAGAMTAVMSVEDFVVMCPRRVLELLQLEGQAGQEVKALLGLLHITDQVKLVREMEKALRLLPGAAQRAG